MLAVPDLTNASILLVDDTPNNLRVLAMILESAGYRTRKSTSGHWALRAAQMEPPDLILLDINMPEINGYEVCRQLKAQSDTCHIPVIFISALDQTADKIQAFEMGGVDYITKPFQEHEVLARVKNQLIIQRQRQQLLEQTDRLEQAGHHHQQTELQLQQLHEQLASQTLQMAQLQRSLDLSCLLHQIVVKVRHSLDERQILQSIVQELALGLGVDCGHICLHSSDRTFCKLTYEFVPGLEPVQGSGCLIAEDADTVLYQQLFQGQSCQFSLLTACTCRLEHPQTALVCPILDEQGVLGDLWLFKPSEDCFSDWEIRLVQQVAQQSAIALRQAQLYQTAQAKAAELEARS